MLLLQVSQLAHWALHTQAPGQVRAGMAYSAIVNAIAHPEKLWILSVLHSLVRDIGGIDMLLTRAAQHSTWLVGTKWAQPSRDALDIILANPIDIK